MGITPLPKPKKQKSRGSLRNKTDWLASAYYRAETPYCELKGLDTIQCGGGLQWMHLFSRAILHMRYEPYNKLVGCQGHHLWYTHHPIEWVRILESHFPERLAEAEENRYKYWKVSYDDWIRRFTDQSSKPTDLQLSTP